MLIRLFELSKDIIVHNLNHWLFSSLTEKKKTLERCLTLETTASAMILVITGNSKKCFILVFMKIEFRDLRSGVTRMDGWTGRQIKN